MSACPNHKPEESNILWDKMFPVIAAIVGTLLGSGVTLVGTGYVESQKLVEQRKARAVAEFLEASWGGSSEAEHFNYTRKVTLLSAYAPSAVLEAIRSYHSTDCVKLGDDSARCRRLWAKVVKELRKMANADDVSEELVVEMIYGEPLVPVERKRTETR